MKHPDFNLCVNACVDHKIRQGKKKSKEWEEGRWRQQRGSDVVVSWMPQKRKGTQGHE